MLKPDSGWDELVSAWRAEDPARPRLREEKVRERVRRQTLWMWLVAGLEVLLTVILLGWSIGVVRGGVDRFDTVLLLTLWTFWAVAAGYAYQNRRGAWRAAGESTRAYLEICADRARRRLRTTRFVVWLLAAEVVVFLGLLAWRQRIEPLVSKAVGSAIGFLVVVSALYIGWAVWTRRRAQHEIEALDELLQELARAEELPTEDPLAEGYPAQGPPT